jgi:hypothetical protein
MKVILEFRAFFKVLGDVGAASFTTHAAARRLLVPSRADEKGAPKGAHTTHAEEPISLRG